MNASRAAGATAYGIARAGLGVAVRLHFRHIEVRHLERLPAGGPVLIAANHAAAFTDVMVIATRLPRRIHFLAMSPLFKPWLRGVLLRLAGALPVYRRDDDARQVGRNEETFRACHEILDEGGAVLIFPEGISETDRRLARIKTGAARLALAQEERPGQAGRLTLVPAGLHFADRTAFQSDVVVSIGRPIDLAPYRARADSEPREAVVWLTAAIQTGIEELILHIPEAEVTGLVHDLAGLYVAELTDRGDPRDELELARRVSDCVEYFRGTDPERIYRMWRRIAGYRARLEALHLSDEVVRERERGRLGTLTAAGNLLLAALGFLPALVGRVVHFVPFRASTWLAGRLAPQPTSVTSARIAFGLIVVPSTYLGLALGIRARTGWSIAGLATALTAIAALGLFDIGYSRWLRRQTVRLRLAFLAARHGRMVASVRRQRRGLIRDVDQARMEFLAATVASPVPPRREGA